MDKCDCADEYDALEKPECDCDYCWDKWSAVPKENGRKKIRRARPVDTRQDANRPFTHRTSHQRRKHARAMTKGGYHE